MEDKFEFWLEEKFNVGIECVDTIWMEEANRGEICVQGVMGCISSMK